MGLVQGPDTRLLRKTDYTNHMRPGLVACLGVSAAERYEDNSGNPSGLSGA